MRRLPEVQAGMKLDQAMLLELLHILVWQGILTEEQAVGRYELRRGQVGSIEWMGFDQESQE